MFHPSKPLIRCATLCASVVLGGACLSAESTSSLVYPGADGRLVYAGYANEGQTSTGNIMIDFSHAGYKGGGVPIPWVPVEITLDPVAGTGDDYPRIQAAINTLSAMPLSPAGFRGTLLLRAGTYHVSETLRISADGVVIRGEGQQEGGTVIRYTATQQSDLFVFRSDNGFWIKIANTETPITDAVVPSGVRSFNVASPAGLSVGDRLMVHRTPNQLWIEDLKMDQLRDLAIAAGHPDPDSIVNWMPEDYVSTTPRFITAIDGNTVTVDAPLVHAIETQYGGGEVYRYHFDNALRNVGIERIRMESDFASETDEAHGWNAVVFSQVENAWARQVTARYFGFSAINIGYRCQYITVEDCAQLDPKSTTAGGRRYPFVISRSSFILMQRCYARQGRHDYVTQDKTRGPNVFVDSLAEESIEDIGPHQRYAEGLLFDNIRGRAAPNRDNGGSMNVQNRNWSGTGHGWSGAQTVFWNCDTDRYMIVDAPVGAMNFSIGNVYAEQRQGRWGPEEPDGIWESRGVPVTPRSLYYAQLADRVGHRAVAAMTTPNQLAGTIWGELSAWRGDSEAPGLPAFLPLRVDAGADFQVEVGAYELDAIIRYPLPGNFPMTQGWTQLDGPAAAVFDDASSPSTTVTFPVPGVYELQFAVSQDDDRDPLNIVTYSGSDTLLVTAIGLPFGTLGPSSVDSIVGRRQENAPALGYYPDFSSDIIGGTGSSADLTRTDRDIVLGYTLPNLPAGATLIGATLNFEIKAYRNESGADPGLDVYLLDTAAPESSGTAFFFRGENDPNPEAVRVGGVNLSAPQGAEVTYPAGTHVPSFTLDGDALALLQSLYGVDGTPTQAEVFFRFNLTHTVSGDTIRLDRYRIDIGPAASGLELFATPGDGMTFAEWIAGFGLDPAWQGPGDDPDGDGIPNAVENFFGTHPGEPSAGIAGVVAGGASFSFTHPQNPNPASNLSAAYRWSTNLVDFHGHGDTNPTGTTVTFSASTTDGITTVHATVAGTATSRLFVLVEANVD